MAGSGITSCGKGWSAQYLPPALRRNSASFLTVSLPGRPGPGRGIADPASGAGAEVVMGRAGMGVPVSGLTAVWLGGAGARPPGAVAGALTPDAGALEA